MDIYSTSRKPGPVSITFSSAEVEGEEKSKIKEAVVVSITEKKSKLVQQVVCPK
ncbi:unnamed protein product [Prunus armeniaca]